MLREHTVKLDHIADDDIIAHLFEMASHYHAHEVVWLMQWIFIANFDHEGDAENFKLEAKAFIDQQNFLGCIDEEEAYTKYRLFI